MSTTTKITAPAKVNTTGEYGGIRLDFVDGVAATTREVNAGLRRYLERRGYTVTTEGTPDQVPQDEGTPPADLFDPAEHDLDEVRDYLATASPEEAARVREAERAGKARKGILGGETA